MRIDNLNFFIGFMFLITYQSFFAQSSLGTDSIIFSDSRISNLEKFPSDDGTSPDILLSFNTISMTRFLVVEPAKKDEGIVPLIELVERSINLQRYNSKNMSCHSNNNKFHSIILERITYHNC